MIVFDLCCEDGHVFEGWFGSSGDFASQLADGLLCCPQCGSETVLKAPMAPAVQRKGNQARRGKSDESAPGAEFEVEAVDIAQPLANAPMPPEVAKALENLAKAQEKALKNSKWVGKEFAEQSRAMHYGERDHEAIHGEASLEDAQDLVDEGVQVAPLPFPIAPPKDLN